MRQRAFRKSKNRKKNGIRYGNPNALVIRDSSGCDWDWEDVKPHVQEYFKEKQNPFDLGIWIVNRMKTRLHRIL